MHIMCSNRTKHLSSPRVTENDTEKKNEVGEVLNVSYIEFYEDSDYKVKIFFVSRKIFLLDFS